MATDVVALDQVFLGRAGGVDVDHGRVHEQRERRAYVEAAEGHARYQREGLHLGVAHGDERLELEPDDVGAALEGARATDELAEIDVNGRIDGCAAQREIAKFDRAELPELLGQPEVFGGGVVGQGRSLPVGVMKVRAASVLRDGAGRVKPETVGLAGG